MNPNLELKQYVFAQYIGQPVAMSDTLGTTFRPLTPNILASGMGVYLHLRPLSSITDQEAIEVAKIYNSPLPDEIHCVVTERNSTRIEIAITYSWGGRLSLYWNGANFYGSNLINKHELAAYQYLQQQGFALPIYFKGVHYSVEQLVADRIITLKQ